MEDPTVEKYDISLTYWIDTDDSTRTVEIQEAVKKAVNKYAEWQRLRLGRDINPTELYYRLRTAGVKRAEIRKPVYTQISRVQVATLGEKTARFEGLEDD